MRTIKHEKWKTKSSSIPKMSSHSSKSSVGPKRISKVFLLDPGSQKTSFQDFLFALWFFVVGLKKPHHFSTVTIRSVFNVLVVNFSGFFNKYGRRFLSFTRSHFWSKLAHTLKSYFPLWSEGGGLQCLTSPPSELQQDTFRIGWNGESRESFHWGVLPVRKRSRHDKNVKKDQYDNGLISE